MGPVRPGRAVADALRNDADTLGPPVATEGEHREDQHHPGRADSQDTDDAAPLQPSLLHQDDGEGEQPGRREAEGQEQARPENQAGSEGVAVTGR
jgi:hypothetical protein